MSNKIRNRFLALVCLLAFIGLGMLFYVNWVVQKPFAIIVFLTDNLNTSTLTAARIYHGGADYRFRLEQLPHLGLLTTHANDFAVSDGSSSTIAIATGQKVNNRSAGVDASGSALVTLFDLAKKAGRTVGIVTNGSVVDPGPAAFFARTANPRDPSAVAGVLADAANLDVILGGGEADFLPEHKDGRRKDGRDLMLEMRRKGYDIARNQSELESTPSWKPPRLLGIFGPGDLAFAGEIEAAGSQPSLGQMVQQAIQHLQFNPKGYLLIVDAGLAGKAASRNEGERVLREMVALDAAVASAIEYAGSNSLILVAGRQTVGGLALNGYPFRNDKGVAVTGINAQGIPSLTWSTGPGAKGGSSGEPSAVTQPSAAGVADDSLVVGTGPGSEKMSGFQDNTQIFRVVAEKL